MLTMSKFDSIMESSLNGFSNHSCDFRKDQIFDLVRSWIIAYQGSTDPGTIKSGYIPTVSNIVDTILKKFKGICKFGLSGNSSHDHWSYPIRYQVDDNPYKLSTSYPGLFSYDDVGMFILSGVVEDHDVSNHDLSFGFSLSYCVPWEVVTFVNK